MLQDKLDHLPSPPEFTFSGTPGQHHLCGKARSLRQRVHSYLQESRHLDPKTEHLVSEIADVEYILTDNEVEALISSRRW